MAEGEKRTWRERYNEARENMRDNKAMQWLKANRVPIGIGVGGVTFGFLLRGKVVHMAPTFNNTVAPVINNEPVFQNVVNNGGHCTKLVKRMSDGTIFETVTEAAEAAGCGVPKMSKHLNGHKAHVNDEIYQIIGLGTTG